MKGNFHCYCASRPEEYNKNGEKYHIASMFEKRIFRKLREVDKGEKEIRCVEQ